MVIPVAHDPFDELSLREKLVRAHDTSVNETLFPARTDREAQRDNERVRMLQERLQARCEEIDAMRWHRGIAITCGAVALIAAVLFWTNGLQMRADGRVLMNAAERVCGGTR